MDRSDLRRRLTPNGVALAVGTALFLVLFLRMTPCVATGPGGSHNALLGCTSEIQTAFLADSMGSGASPLTGGDLTLSPVLAVILFGTARIASALSGRPAVTDIQGQVDASVAFFGLTSVLLFVCFAALIGAAGYFGRRVGDALSRDSLLIAASPIVLAVGLVSWDLIPLAMTGIGLALFARRRTVPAALVLAIASCTGTMPIAVSVGVLVAVGLRGGLEVAARFAIPWLAAFLAIHLPLIAIDPGRIWDYYRAEAGGAPGPGSLWFVAQQLGLDQPHAGSVGFAVTAIALGCLFGLLRTTGRRPRVGSMIAIVVLTVAIAGPAFPPQTALWALLAMVVARPNRRDLIAVTVTQVLHAIGLWAWLGGALSGAPWVYWLTVIAQVGVLVWLLAETLWDVARPTRDAVRAAFDDDPIGGELNDHPWVAARPGGRTVADAEAAEAGTTTWARWRRPILAAAIATVVTRVVFMGAAYATQWLMVTDQVKPFFDWKIWLQWDAYHFVAIAEQGYGPDIVAGNAPAFFPLFPLGLRVLTTIGLEPVHAGLLISAVSTFVASAYLYRLAELHGFDGERSVVYLLLFPTGVFLVAPYTEALFLAGAVPAFYYGLRGRPWPAAVFTAIAVGSRTVGLFVLLGVAIELARRAWPSWKKMASAVAAMVVASLPFWAYGLYLSRVRGSFWTFMEVQKEGWGRDFMGFTDGFLATWHTWEGDYGANLIFTWRLEIVFALLSLILLVWLMWRGYLGYSIYVGATLLIGLSNAWYYSTPRLALAFFPFAFLIAAFVKRRDRANTYVVLAMASIATVGVVAYTRGAWFF